MRRVAVLPAVSAGLVAMSVVVLAVAGTDEAGVSLWVRSTARSSLALLLLVYTARPLVALSHARPIGRLLAHRRELGLAFAVSHGLHAIGIAWLVLGFGRQIAPVTAALGGLGYAFIVAMAATSSDAAVRRMGRRRWKLLHRAGVHYLMLVFAATYMPMAVAERALIPVIASALILVAMAARVVAWLRPR